jgi:PAS domain S-box-containing protein
MKIQEEKLKLSSVELKKKLEQSRKELEQQYRLVIRERDRMMKTLEGDPAIILSMDQASRILFLNRSAEKFFGVSSASALGKNVKTLFQAKSPDLDPFILSLFDRDAVRITGEAKELSIPDKNGRMHRARMHLSIAELGDEVSYTAFISLI